MLYLKPFVPAVFTAFVATLEAQPYFMIGALVLAVIGGWRALRVRDFNAEIAALKAANETAQIVKTNDDELIAQLREQIVGAQTRAGALEKEAERWRAQYDAIKPYSAQPAFEKLEEIISQMVKQGDKRHRETIDLIRRLAGEKSVTDK